MSNPLDLSTALQQKKKPPQAGGNITDALAGGAVPHQSPSPVGGGLPPEAQPIQPLAPPPAPAPSSNLGWVPKDHPLYGTKGYVGYEEPVTPLPGEVDDTGPTWKPIPNLPPELAQPTTAPTAPTGGTPMTPQEAAAAGLGWVDQNHPLYGTPGYVGSTPAPAPTAPTPTAPQPAPTQPGLPPEAQPITPTPPPAGTPGAPAPAPGATAPPPTTVPGAFQQALLSRLTQDPNAVSMNSVEIKGAVDANRLAGQRSAERQRAMARERQVAQGVTGGATDVELQGIEQDRGEREGAFEGNLVAKAAQDRRNELLTVMTLAGNQMTAEQQQALTKELATLDATIRREGLAQNKELAGQGLGLQRESLAQQKLLAELDAAIRREGMQSQTGLGAQELELRNKLGSGQLNLGLLGLLQNNDQFGKQLGANMGMFGANLNQQALLSLLGGL